MPQIGQPAPDFTLPSTAGGEVALSSFRGKQNVLIAFFPLAFTGVCTAELCAFSEDYAKFETAGTKVLPVSVDAVPSLKAFKKQEGMTVELLSDIHRRASRAYDVLIEEKNHSRRAYFLVDKAGILRWSHVESELGHRRDDAELLAEIGKL
ncbi:MAG: redoxin domain-containing protein [Gemmatimonadota bacterium]